MRRVASYRNRRTNTYVPAAAYAADVIHDASYEVDFLTPVAASLTNVVAATVTPTAGVATALVADTADSPFGRNVALGGAAGAVGATINGRDYLGQPQSEVIAASGVGNKAFKWIDSVIPAATGAVGTLTVGFGSKLGLPYRMAAFIGEIGNGAPAAAGTFVSGVLTDPQTNATGDPKGTYAPATVLNGANRILAKFRPYNVLNANGNGGLYGIAAA